MTFIRHRVIAVASIVILSVVVVAALGTGASALTTRTVAPAGHGSPRLVFPLLTPAGPAPTAEVLPGGAIVRHSGDSFEKADEEGYVESLTTGTWAFEPTLGFTESGALFFQGYAVHQGDQEVLFDTLSYPFVLRSGDGGVTWKDVTPMDDLGNPRHELTWDPYLYVDPETSRVFTVDYQPGTCALVSWSDDDGETWTTNRTACGLTDHQNVFAGPAKFSPTVDYPNVVYYCSIGFGLAVLSAGSGCQKSLDGGNSFIPVGSPFVNNPVMHEEGFADIRGFCAGPLAPGAVGPDGTVYVPSGQCGRPWLAISHDEGLTWSHVKVDEGSDVGFGTAEGYGGLTEPRVPATPATPEMGFPSDPERAQYSHYVGFGVDQDGNLYYAWVARDRYVYLSASRDAGATWSTPARVSPPNLTETTLPILSVGSPGRVAIAYMGSENAPGAFDCPHNFSGCPETASERYRDATWTGYITVTADAFSDEPTFVTGAASPPEDPFKREYCGQINCAGLGDFFDVTIGPDGFAWASFADACDANGCRDGDNGAVGVVMHMVAGPKLVALHDCDKPGLGPGPGSNPHGCPPGSTKAQ